MGLKKADPSRLKELLPKKEKSLDPQAMASHIQKLRSFRYQMKNTLAGDNLDTAEELAQKGILSNGELSMSLERHRNGFVSLARGLPDISEKVDTAQLKEAFGVPRDFASAIERLDGPESMKRSVELMGQCVQVQRSAHGVLMHAMETQDALNTALMDKVRLMGLPVSCTPDVPGAAPGSGKASGAAGGDGSISLGPHQPKSPSSSREGNRYVGLGTLAGNRRTSLRINSGGGGGSSVPAPTRPAGVELYAGVASMLQASAESMKAPVPAAPAPLKGKATNRAKRGIPGVPNLCSFVPTATASNNNAPAPSTSTSNATEAGALALSSLGQAVAAASAKSIAPFFSGAGVGLGVEAGNYWEMGILDGGGFGGFSEALDETSLRMEMQTSMDMHRVMRSRQKDQMQLHPLQGQQQQEEGRGDGSAGNLSAHAVAVQESGKAANNRSSPSGPPQGSAPPASATTGGSVVAGRGRGSSAGGSTTSRRPGDTPLPDPPPGKGAAQGAEALAHVGSSNSVVEQDAVATPTLLNVDFPWEEVPLEDFSFLLDT